jgi:hypothetical protein
MWLRDRFLQALFMNARTETNSLLQKQTLYLLQTKKSIAQTQLNLNITPGFFPPSSNAHTQ